MGLFVDVRVRNGLLAHFLFVIGFICSLSLGERDALPMQQHSALEGLIAPLVQGLGFQWVGLQYFPQGRHSILRVYLDKPGGVTLEDCTRVSRQIQAALSVEDLLTSDPILEVSSPGLDRLLFNAQQCCDHMGRRIAVRLAEPVAGKRNFKGVLESVEGDTLFILVEDEGRKAFAFSEIDEVRLAP